MCVCVCVRRLCVSNKMMEKGFTTFRGAEELEQATRFLHENGLLQQCLSLLHDNNVCLNGTLSKLAGKCRDCATVSFCRIQRVVLWMQQHYFKKKKKKLNLSGCSHVGSLFANEDRKRLACDVVYHSVQLHLFPRLGQNGSTHGHLSAIFKHWFKNETN